MHDRPLRRLLAAAGSLGVAVLLLAGPAALAQTDGLPDPEEELSWEQRWAASALDAPFDVDDHVVRVQPFSISGAMRYEKQGPTDHIVRVEVRVVDDPADTSTPGAGCTLPEPVVVAGSGPQPELTSEVPFLVDGVEVLCNGAYVVEVEATVDDPEAPTYTLRRPFAMGMLPPAVTDLAVDLDEGQRRATVTFTPVPDDQLAPDAIGYVLERGGPVDDAGALGAFVDVATLDLDDEARFVDDLARAPGGTYEYRVRAMRAGAEQPERSSIIDTETARVTIGAPPQTPTTQRGSAVVRRSTRRGAGAAVRGGASARPTTRMTPTTLDTGYEDTLDYGDRPPGSPAIPGDEPLAGQSVIRDEGEGLDLAGPVAGALVLVGWAGHIAYLNRLAKHL